MKLQWYRPAREDGKAIAYRGQLRFALLRLRWDVENTAQVAGTINTRRDFANVAGSARRNPVSRQAGGYSSTGRFMLTGDLLQCRQRLKDNDPVDFSVLLDMNFSHPLAPSAAFSPPETHLLPTISIATTAW